MTPNELREKAKFYPSDDLWEEFAGNLISLWEAVVSEDFRDWFNEVYEYVDECTIRCSYCGGITTERERAHLPGCPIGMFERTLGALEEA